MTFNIQELPSGGVYFTGKLTQKKLTAKAKRQVLLCFPSSVQDIKVLQTQLSIHDSSSQIHTSELSPADMEIFGHLSLASISGFPLLIVGTNSRTFIHFGQIEGLYDETDLKTACSFALLTSLTEYRFHSETSTDYQKWVGALTKAFENMAVANSENQGARKLHHPDSISDTSRPASMMSRDPEDYVEAHRTLSFNRSIQRKSTRARRGSIFSTKSNNDSPSSTLNGNSNQEQQYSWRSSVLSKLKAIFQGSKSKDQVHSAVNLNQNLGQRNDIDAIQQK